MSKKDDSFNMIPRIRIHLYHKLPTPYNDMFFRALSNDRSVSLEVYHLWKHRDNRPWTIELARGYKNNFLNTKFLGIDWSFLKKAITDRNSFFMIGDWAHVSSITVLIVRILLRAPVSIWADTPQEHLHRPWFKRLPRRLFLSRLLPRMDVVFGTGKCGIEALVTMGVTPSKVVNLPCFVDLQLPNLCKDDEKFKILSRKYRNLVVSDESELVILMAGMCTYKKGQDVGLKAIALSIKHSKNRIGVLIAGDGPERGNLERIAEELGIMDNVAFLGWLDPDDMNAAFLACDILVHSARWDPFPLVILEGMSWGKVVIGSDVCGSVQDRIVSGENGYVFSSEDVNELATIIRKVSNDSALRRKLGDAARQTAEQWPVERGVATIIDAARKSFIKKNN